MADDKIEPMTDDEVSTAVGALLDSAVTYSESVLAPARAQATDYYQGEPFGTEEDGRSQFVITEVRDAVLALLPGMAKLFFGPERQVEFAPRRPNQVTLAQHLTEYVHTLFAEQGGFVKTYAVWKDAFVRKIGVFKRGWSEGERTAYVLRDVTDEELAMLAADDATELVRVEQTGTRPPQLAEDGQTVLAPGTKLHRVELTVRGPAGPWIEPVPPEEFLYTQGARSLETADLVAHQMDKTLSELVEMGYNAKEIQEHGGESDSLATSAENLARQPEGTTLGGTDQPASKANEKYRYVEAYARIDADGDGYAELRKLCLLGPKYHVLHNEPVSRLPFAIYVPDIEPHTLTGLSIADLTMDVQKMKSFVFRAQADGLAASIFPRTVFVETQVNINDVLNTEIGAPIRARAPGMVQTLDFPYKGGDAEPIMDRLEAIVERRTGQRRGVADGLDMDALQSTSDAGVSAAVGAAQARLELYAYLFAEMCLKPLFRGLFLDIIEHQPETVMARIGGEFVELDPRSWDPAMQLEVKVALGSTLTQQRLAALTSIIGEIKEVIAALGPSNPVAGLPQYTNALRDAAMIAGFKDASPRYFNTLPADWHPPQQEPQKSPEQVLAEAEIQREAMRVQKELQIKQAEFELRKMEQDREYQRNIEKDAAELALKQMELRLKYQSEQLDREFEQEQQRNQQLLEGHKATVQAALQTDAHEHEKEMSQAQMEHDQQLAREQQAHDQEMADRQTAAAEQAAASSGESE